MNPKLIKKQFEKSFDTYNENATVQRLMAENLVKEIVKVRTDFNNVLELGSGTGLLTTEITKHLKFKNFYANDLVEKSEQYIKKIIPSCQFYFGNALDIKLTHKMDLIISNAVFQWFESLKKAEQIYNSILNKDGIMAFTSFTPDNYKEIKELTGLSLNYKTLDEITEIFSDNFEIIYSDEFKHILKFPTPLQLLEHMQNTGVNSLTSKHWTIKETKNFCNKYKEKYPDISLTYSGIIFIAKKK